MSVQILKESDGSLAPLQGKTVAIIGFGSQGHAHAQNARDSGINVIVSELEGTDNHKAAVEAGSTGYDRRTITADTRHGTTVIVGVDPQLLAGDTGGTDAVEAVAQAAGGLRKGPVLGVPGGAGDGRRRICGHARLVELHADD